MAKPQHYHNAFRASLRERIESLPGEVFTRDDLTQDHSNGIQLRLNRALKAFVDEGFIIKLSHGLYAKAELITLPQGQTKPVLRAAFESVAIEALHKLNIAWEYGEAIQAYNRGETTQIPILFSIKLKSRFRGIIGAEGRTVVFEGGINAR